VAVRTAGVDAGAVRVFTREYSELEVLVGARILDWTINPLVLSEGSQRWLVPVAMIGR
jgi:hypothetical protein